MAAAPFLLRAEPGHAQSVAIVTAPDGVNLRSGPGLSFPVITVIPFGASLTVTGDVAEGNWLPVTYRSESGYVLGDYIAVASPSPSTASSRPIEPATATQPGSFSTSPSPTVAVPLTAAPASSPSAPPQVGTSTLGASAAFSTAPTATPTPAPPVTPAPTATLTAAAAQPPLLQYATVLPAEGLNLRSGPGTNFSVVITVPGGARVQVVGRPTADNWYSVVYNDRLGWVKGEFLNFGVATSTPSFVPAPTATPTPAPASSGGSRFIWPVESRRISTVFSPGHPGLDIDEFPSGGNPVVATADGVVTFAGGRVCCSYGLYVIVRHADGYTSLYSHLSSIAVSEGQEVRQGQLLGRSGNTGNSTGAHLHFEIRKDGVAINPLSVLPGSYAIE